MGAAMAAMMAVWFLLLLVLLALAVAALIWLVRRLREDTGRSTASAGASPARVELDRRYAAGEISREEYRQRREDIST